MFPKWVIVNFYSVMNCPLFRHTLKRTLKVADTDVLHVRIVAIELAQCLFVRVVNGVNEWEVNCSRHRESRSIVQVQNVAIARSISDGLGGVMDIFEVTEDVTWKRPF